MADGFDGPDLLSGIVAGHLADGVKALVVPQGSTGLVRFEVEIGVESGRVTWSNGQMAYRRRRSYKGAKA